MKVYLLYKDKQKEIELYDDLHTLGRGLLECDNDVMLISRNHGMIRINETDITIRANHINPIFYKQKSESVTKVLNKDNEINLENGDCFSLLPGDKIAYEIKIINTEENTQGPRKRNASECSEKENNEIEGNKKQKVDQNETIQLPIPGTSSNNEEVASTSTAAPNQNDPADSTNTNFSETVQEVPQITPTPNIKQEPADEEATTSQTVSTTTTSVPIIKEEKKVEVKSEPVDSSALVSGTDCTVSSTNNNANATNSNQNQNNQNNSNNNNININTNHPVATVRPTVRNGNLRESCRFGIRCYRHGADHRSEFAHPGDNDYRRPDFPPASANAPQCPFGAGCYRRNPQHFQDYQHPPASAPVPTPTRTVVVIAQSNMNVPDNDSESENDFDLGSDFSADSDSDLYQPESDETDDFDNFLDEE